MHLDVAAERQGRSIVVLDIDPQASTTDVRRLWEAHAIKRTRGAPLNVPPPRKTRFGSPLILSRVHWIEPKLTYLTWTADNLLRHTVYVGLRGKPADHVRRE
jgi:cellulose biosynthesis protein BcsQ